MKNKLFQIKEGWNIMSKYNVVSLNGSWKEKDISGKAGTSNKLLSLVIVI